jgi:hypothetical protein
MDLAERLAELERRVAQLEADRWSGPPRLGPRPKTRAEEEAEVQRLAEILRRSLRP